MPDSQKPKEGDDPAKSSTKLKVTVPHTAQPERTEFTQVEVDPGTREHQVFVEEVSSPLPQHEGHASDRRKAAPPVQVLMQQSPPSGGLMGKWAQFGNMSAVALIMGLLVWGAFSYRSDERERRSIEREDRINDRSQTQAAFAAITSAITTMSTRNDARDSRIDAMLEESRLARNEMRQTQQEMLNVLKAILAKNNPMNPEESTAAPMPRAKRAEG